MPPKRRRSISISLSGDSSRGSSERAIILDNTWATGKFEVITVDNVRFRVPDYLLLSASKVLADAHSFSVGEKKIELVGDNETAEVFRAFLKLASEGEVEVGKYLSGMTDLAVFLKKWDFPGSLANLLRIIRLGLLNGELCPLSSFELAAALDDVELAKTALSVQDWIWGDSGPKATEGFRSCPVLNPNGWSLKIWRNMTNCDYIFALVRAYCKVGNTSKLADTFAEYLAAAKAVPRE